MNIQLIGIDENTFQAASEEQRIEWGKSNLVAWAGLCDQAKMWLDDRQKNVGWVDEWGDIMDEGALVLYEQNFSNINRLAPDYQPPVKPEELTIEEMNYSKERGMHIAMSHPLFAKLTHEMCKFFEESGAVNYLEFEARSDKYGPMLVCIQRAEGKTPAQENVRLKAENKALADALRVRMQGWVCEECSGFIDEHPHKETCHHYETEKKVTQQG